MTIRSVCGWILATVLAPAPTFAHSPHDVITDVAAGRREPFGSHTFILITDQVFRSDGEGRVWKNLVNGLNSQYSFTSLAVSPGYASDRTLFVASSGDGVFRSRDSGDSWDKVVSGLESHAVSQLSISPGFSTDGRILAVSMTGGVWRSVDRGDSWQMVLTEAVRFASLFEAGTGVVLAGDAEGYVWRSDDNGRLWSRVFRISDAGIVTSVAGDGTKIFVGTERAGLYVSRDGGATLDRLSLPEQNGESGCTRGEADNASGDTHVTSLTIAPGPHGEDTVYVTSWYGGVYLSADDGNTWRTWRDGLSCDSQANRQSLPHFNDLEIVESEGGEQIFWLGAFDGLFRGDDVTMRWQQPETLPVGLIKGMAVAGGDGRPLSIALSTYGGGFYLTDDRGATWTIGNKGLLTTRLTGLAFSPDYDDDGVIYAGAIRRLLQSKDRGRSWRRIRLDKPGFSQRVRNKLSSWGLPMRSSNGRGPVYPTHIAPLTEDDAGRILIATRYHGVLAFDVPSGDVKSRWSGTDRVMNSLVISPDFDRDGTLFSSIRSEGVYRSDDGGTTWVATNAGLDFVGDWDLHPGRGDFRRDVKLAISPGFFTDGTLFAGSPASDGLYVSENRGESWTRLGTPFGASPAPVLSIAVSPAFESDHSLLVSVKGKGLFRSRNRGSSFDRVGDELLEASASVEYLEYSPSYSQDSSIVAASDEQLFLSTDGGDSWTGISRPVRYEDMREVVIFRGNHDVLSGEQYSAMTETILERQGSSVSLRFVGDGIRMVGTTGPDCGTADVLVDGKHIETVDCRSDALHHIQEIFTIRGLGMGPHTVEVRVRDAADGRGAANIGIDAFDVLPQAARDE